MDTEFTPTPTTWPLTDFIFDLHLRQGVVEQAVIEVDYDEHIIQFNCHLINCQGVTLITCYNRQRTC